MQEISIKLGDHEVRRCSFDQDTISIGRAKDNDVVIDSLCVSRHHAKIIRRGDRHYISDLDSKTGVAINGIFCRFARLQSRDMVSIGKHRLNLSLQNSGVDGDDPDGFGILPLPEPSAHISINMPKSKTFSYILNKPIISIGRSRRSKLRIADWFINNFEALLERNGDSYRIRSLAQSSSLLRNNVPCVADSLSDGDTLQFGVSWASVTINKQGKEGADMVQPSELNADEFDLSLPDPEEFLPEAFESADQNNIIHFEPFAPDSLGETSESSPEIQAASALQIRFWEKALGNKSLAVRKHAALQLKKLTGRDYDP